MKKSVGIREICGTKIIDEKNLCKSVKSVGLKQSMRKNLRHLRNLRDKNNRSPFLARAIGQRPNIRGNP